MEPPIATTRRHVLRPSCQARQRFRRQLISPLKIERLAKSSNRAGAVFVLRSALLGDDDQPTGGMAKSNRRAGLVTFLPAGAAGAVRVHRALRQQLRIAKVGPGCSSIESHHESHESHERETRKTAMVVREKQVALRF